MFLKWLDTVEGEVYKLDHYFCGRPHKVEGNSIVPLSGIDPYSKMKI